MNLDFGTHIINRQFITEPHRDQWQKYNEDMQDEIESTTILLWGNITYLHYSLSKFKSQKKKKKSLRLRNLLYLPPLDKPVWPPKTVTDWTHFSPTWSLLSYCPALSPAAWQKRSQLANIKVITSLRKAEAFRASLWIADLWDVGCNLSIIVFHCSFCLRSASSCVSQEVSRT